MPVPSNEVLADRYDTMKEQNNKEHWELKNLLVDMSKKIDSLWKVYVTRLEFKAVSAVLWVLAVSLGIIGFFTWK